MNDQEAIIAHKTIFVQIASYRDDELVKTIESCLGAAKHPDRLRFGIVHQWDEATQHDLERYKNDARFRIKEMPWQESRGVGYARHLCNMLYVEEDFMMQIDSHMRFDDGWDSEVLSEWHSCLNQKAVLSAYPSPFEYKDDREKRLPYGPTQLVVKKFSNGKIPIFKGVAVTRRPDGGLRRAMYVAGGFVFGEGRICQDVPYTKEVCFTGEEMVYSLRLFSHGYTVYTPNTLGIYHLYDRPTSSRFWDDMPKAEEDAVRKHHAEMMTSNDMFLKRLFNGEANDVLGVERTLQEFENYSGVSFDKKLVHPDQTAHEEPPYAYSDEWTEKAFRLRDIEMELHLKTLYEKYDRSRTPVMWRVKLMADHDIEVYSVDVPFDDLQADDFHVSVKATVRQTPVVCRVRPYFGDDDWDDPKVSTLDMVV